MARNGFPSAAVKEVYKAYPGVLEFNYLRDFDNRYCYSLFAAVCAHKPYQDDVDFVRFLAQENPGMLVSGPSENPLPVILPIYLALRNRAPEETIRLLLEMAPTSVLPLQQQSTMQLHDAFSTAYSKYALQGCQNVLKMVGDTIVRTTNSYRVAITSIDRNFSNVLAYLLLPRLAELEVYSNKCSLGAFVHIFRCMRSNKKIRRLKLNISAIRPGLDTQEVADSLKIFFECNKDVKELDMACNHHRRTLVSMDRCFQGIADGLHSNTSLSALRIHHFCLTKISGIHDILSASSHMLSLTLSRFMVDCEAWSFPTTAGKRSILKKIALSNFDMPPDCLVALIHFISAELSHLESFHVELTSAAGIEKFSNTDCTEPLLRILEQGKLRSWKTVGLKVDLGWIWEALNGNTSLTQFDCSTFTLGKKSLVRALVEHNMRLTKFSIECSWEREDPSQETTVTLSEWIGYYTGLNTLGRAKALSNGISLAAFIGLLGAALPPNNSDDTHGNQSASDPLKLFNTHYYFLRERPDLWTTDPLCNGRKRKRGIIEGGRSNAIPRWVRSGRRLTRSIY